VLAAPKVPGTSTDCQPRLPAKEVSFLSATRNEIWKELFENETFSSEKEGTRGMRVITRCAM